MASCMILGDELLHPLSFLTSSPLPLPIPQPPHTLNFVTSRVCFTRKSLTSPSLTTASFISTLHALVAITSTSLQPHSRPLTPRTWHFPCCLDLIIDPIGAHGYTPLCPLLPNTFSLCHLSLEGPSLSLCSSSTSVFMPNSLEKFTHT